MEDFTQEFTQGKAKEAMKAAGASSADLYMIPPDRIHTKEGFNVRQHDDVFEAKVRWLMSSIIMNGYDRTKPISGFVALEDGQNIVYAIDGHRRLEAVNRLIEQGHEIDAIPVVLKPRGTSMEDLTIDLYLSNESDPIDLYGQAVLVKRMVGFGTSENRIAERMNMSTEKVTDLLHLAAAPSALRQMVMEGKVAATVAIDTIKQHGDKALDKLQAAWDKANGKVTAKHLATPDVIFKKAIKKQAPLMYDTLLKVQADPGFAHLSEDMQVMLQDLVQNLPQQ